MSLPFTPHSNSSDYYYLHVETKPSFRSRPPLFKITASKSHGAVNTGEDPVFSIVFVVRPLPLLRSYANPPCPNCPEVQGRSSSLSFTSYLMQSKDTILTTDIQTNSASTNDHWYSYVRRSTYGSTIARDCRGRIWSPATQ